MLTGSRTKTDRSPAVVLSSIAEAVQLAEDYLNRAVDASGGYDPQVVKEIRTELASLDNFRTRLAEALSMSDDALFAKAAGALKSQVPALQAVSDSVKRTASDTATPPGVGGYMEQTATFISQIVVLLGELP